MSKRPELFRGRDCGVFEGPNGYYCAAMAADGVSHYQPASGGRGWTVSVLLSCNAEAQALDNEGASPRKCIQFVAGFTR